MSGFAPLNANGQSHDAAWMKSVQAAFPAELRDRMIAAGSQNVQLSQLFADIAQHVLSAQHQSEPHSNTKKRKLDDSSSQAPTQAQTNGASSAALKSPQSVFSCKDVSFQIPVRKKLKLDLAADAKNPNKQEIRLVNQTSNETEYVLRADQIEQAFCMAVPDKQARQTNFVLYPKVEEGVEPVVFALNEAAPVQGALTGCGAIEEGDTYASLTEKSLNRTLVLTGIKLVKPTDAEFASAIPQSHRKGEKGYHVRAHRGSKEGEKRPHALRFFSTKASLLTALTPRLPLLPSHRHLLRLQEAARLLPLRQRRFHLLHLRPPTHFQPRHHISRCHHQRDERNGVQHARPSGLRRHR